MAIFGYNGHKTTPGKMKYGYLTTFIIGTPKPWCAEEGFFEVTAFRPN